METIYVEQRVSEDQVPFYYNDNGTLIIGKCLAYSKVVVKENNKNFIERTLYNWKEDTSRWVKNESLTSPANKRAVKYLLHKLQYEGTYTMEEGWSARVMSPLEALVRFGKEE